MKQTTLALGLSWRTVSEAEDELASELKQLHLSTPSEGASIRSRSSSIGINDELEIINKKAGKEGWMKAGGVTALAGVGMVVTGGMAAPVATAALSSIASVGGVIGPMAGLVTTGLSWVGGFTAATAAGAIGGGVVAPGVGTGMVALFGVTGASMVHSKAKTRMQHVKQLKCELIRGKCGLPVTLFVAGYLLDDRLRKKMKMADRQRREFHRPWCGAYSYHCTLLIANEPRGPGGQQLREGGRGEHDNTGLAAGKRGSLVLGMVVSHHMDSLRVERILRGGVADKAGVLLGSMLISVGGQRMRTLADFEAAMAAAVSTAAPAEHERAGGGLGAEKEGVRKGVPVAYEGYPAASPRVRVRAPLFVAMEFYSPDNMATSESWELLGESTMEGELPAAGAAGAAGSAATLSKMPSAVGGKDGAVAMEEDIDSDDLEEDEDEDEDKDDEDDEDDKDENTFEWAGRRATLTTAAAMGGMVLMGPLGAVIGAGAGYMAQQKDEGGADEEEE
jgi:hypothetical protein